VATDAGLNQAMKVEEPVIQKIQGQFARFGADCRLYAPIYQQATLGAIIGPHQAQAVAVAGQSIADAWKQYLAHYNHGRGVVLIGHSQGSGLIYGLLKDQIDPNPAERRLLISSIIPGTPVGPHDFKHIPLCNSDEQTGCVIPYSDFYASQPPTTGAVFGHTLTGATASCRNPAALGGGTAPSDLIFATTATPAFNDTTRDSTIKTPWIELPGLLHGECTVQNTYGFLSISDTAKAN
jgi:hypothetical protein